MEIKNLIRDIPDFPKQGVVFKDIMPLLQDAEGFKCAVDTLSEHISKWNPEIILIVGNADYDVDWFVEKKIFRCVKAVKEGRVYKLGHYLSWSPRLILALIEMAKYIHPDKCEELDIESVKNELAKITSIQY